MEHLLVRAFIISSFQLDSWGSKRNSSVDLFETNRKKERRKINIDKLMNLFSIFLSLYN